ncbi:hypothetical protein [Lachnobacterium bovis]|uniref:hypothetical protein n=1 Tax=Lachnobacterium bovis TaxID=140626 RepID=UPI0003B600F4|nr:hypothetical protein [Lachnobacterium bovis]
MKRTEKITNTTSNETFNDAVRFERAYMFPFTLNENVWICFREKQRAVSVFVTDISINGIQLSGSWYTWDELEKSGGVYESEFDALRSMS